jgi:glycosyltransferase involved in cell wall biosynthesis
MPDRPVLSICIPTYNRIEILHKIILDILSLPLETIEIVVVNNCSTDSTKETLQKIDDKRLVVYSNKENVGAAENFIKAMTYCRGIYAMLCLDKDGIITNNLPEFISMLENNRNIIVGNCIPDNKSSSTYFECFFKGLDSIKNLAYLSQHPTGLFYKTEYLHKLEIFKFPPKEYMWNSLIYEFLIAELASIGDGCTIRFPLIRRSTPEENMKYKSKSFYNKGIDNFIFPESRKKEYMLYISHLHKLELSIKGKEELTKYIFWRGIVMSTLSYRYFLSQPWLQEHYGFKYRDIGFFEYLTIDLKYCATFINSDIPLRKIKKINIVIGEHIKQIMRIKPKNTLRYVFE